MPPKIARLAGLGAFGACAAFVALFAYVAYISRHTPTGGMMPALSAVTWISRWPRRAGADRACTSLIGKQLLLPREGRPRALTQRRRRRTRCRPTRRRDEVWPRAASCDVRAAAEVESFALVQDAGRVSDVRTRARARRVSRSSGSARTCSISSLARWSRSAFPIVWMIASAPNQPWTRIEVVGAGTGRQPSVRVLSVSRERCGSRGI